jgi:hypothetical protein
MQEGELDMPEDQEFTQVEPGPVPEIVFKETTISVTELSEYTLTHSVRFKAPLTKVGPEFLFTGSILMSTDGRLYFIPSGEFDNLKSISSGAPPAAG